MATPPENPTQARRYAGLFRRLFAIFYDIFLLTAILLVIAAIAMQLNHGKAIETSDDFRPLYILFMFGICYLYFAWFWMHGGQTLGMKTWQIQLHSIDQTPIDWKTAAIRFVGAIFSWGILGLGFLWSLYDKKNRCWHDLSSKTILLDMRNT
ncbi:MAG TPA: RDD family protein [Gammaproteobacteria bacterium]|nr:RDD family protein [Gammaproteobacteria bacterium]